MIDFKNIHNTEWNKKRISIIGAGKSGIAAAKLGQYIGAQIFISDDNKSSEIQKNIKQFDYELGNHSMSILDSDLVIISPGISDKIECIQNCIKNDIPIVSEIEFASWFTNSPILALTGSNGKTTTVNLLHEMCLSDGNNSLLGGNIGIPFSKNVLYEIKNKIKSAIHVLELSSFQLEHIKLFSPHISGILNISPDHMNRYNSFDDYANTKLNLAKYTKKTGYIIYNYDDQILSKSLNNINNGIKFSLNKKNDSYYKLNNSNDVICNNDKSNILFESKKIKLKGIHNLQNILAAANMAHAFGINNTSIKKAIINFSPIEHRLEWIGCINNINYYNDSKATNLDASKAAIKSFDNNLIVILGGQDKGSSNFSELKSIMAHRVKFIITYGEAGKKIESQLNSSFNCNYILEFEQAIIHANTKALSGDTILLSPACASFDQFNNYIDRGNKFKQIYMKLEQLL